MMGIDPGNSVDVRDAPSPEFIEGIRAAYPVEPEVDVILTRKMQRRSAPSASLMDLARLRGCLEDFLRDNLAEPFEIDNVGWLSGGASKMQMRFTLRRGHAGGQVDHDLVLRMEPSESLNASSRQNEFELLTFLADDLPVPRPRWVDATGRWFPEPVLIYDFARGVTKPPQRAGGVVTGIGTTFDAEYRKLLGGRFVDHLARIHTHGIDRAALPSFAFPPVGSTQSAQWQINRTRRIWEEDRGEAFPMMDVAVNWLNRNVPELDVASINHGDYRAGNFLFDPHTGAFTAILDWERAYIGDRHRDLAWSGSRILGQMDETGRTFLVCGLVPEAEFFDRYQAASGLSIDRKKLRFYEVLNRYQQVQTVLGTAYRVIRLAKSHQNIVVARLEAVAYSLAEELRATLEEEI